MIIKPKKKENVERPRFIFLFILLLSIIIIYFTLNNSSLAIKPFIYFNNKYLLFFINNKFYLLIILILYNYGNIFQILILFYVLFIPQFIFFILSKINFCFNQNVFFQFFLFIFFFLVLGHIIFTKENKIIYLKSSLLYLMVFIIILFLVSNYLAIMNNSIILVNKIISGFFLAIPCYYFIFFVVNINHFNGLQLFNIIDYINNNVITSLLFVLIILLIYSKIYNKYFVFLLFCLCLIIPLLGIKYELILTFKSNKRNWKDFNFTSDEDNNINNNNLIMNTLITKIKITKPIKWNKTSIFYDILRLIFLLFNHILISFFSGKIEDDNLSTAFLFLAFSIFLFLLSKILMYWMELINMTFFYLESDSINSE
jgi:hypothetical protein